ncbi:MULTISPECIES: hypothetical protein [Serratia]|uniref:hypothetical protein n=1 Tax=Serratia TaxID=613 RepID=UPI001185EC7F|nr:hypothetical protein [Serratia marcescens]MBN5334417.1 hypothetical protein [Serratia marcescens]MBN5338442.1 hypothetical protein [Serratia marcescens]MCW7558388.1 hypothetical protein [Serratia marcescens]MCW7563292.1 hypothetical protein [Serratia marcescens]MCW7568204.1 hypothetical protein [Serratia marcescens]
MPVRRQQSHPADKRINRESLRAADGRRVVVLAVHKLAAPRQAIFAVIFSPSVVPLRHWAVFVVIACAEKPFFLMEKYEE